MGRRAGEHAPFSSCEPNKHLFVVYQENGGSQNGKERNVLVVNTEAIV